MNESSKPLNIDGLGKTHGDDHWALQDLNVSVEPGTVLAVLGPSGSGKSTLLNLVAGLLEPSAGSIRIGDTVLSTPEHQIPPERRDVSMVFQDYALWPHMTVADIIGYGLRYGSNRLPSREHDQRVEELMEWLQLDQLGQRRPAELSGGQQQRVSIARALATRPSLLLFDEPLSNLDTQLRNEMRDELGLLFDQIDTTVIYVTHDFSEALALADTILILEQGRTMQIASPQEVFSQPASPWAANLAGFTVALQPEAIRHEAGSVQMQLGGTWLPATAGAGLSDEPGDYEAVVHPEGIRVDEHGDLGGKVWSSTYEGRRWRNRIAYSGTGTVVAFSEMKLQPGSSINLSISPDSVLVFNRKHAIAAGSKQYRKVVVPSWREESSP